MTVKTRTELSDAAVVIRDEAVAGANTAGRVGGFCKDLVDSTALSNEIEITATAVATTAVGTLSGTTTTIDGILLNGAGTSVALLTAESTPANNGVWVIQSGPWTRPANYAAGSNAGGKLVTVQQGTVYADTVWLCTADYPNDVVDTDGTTWERKGVTQPVIGENDRMAFAQALAIVYATGVKILNPTGAQDGISLTTLAVGGATTTTGGVRLANDVHIRADGASTGVDLIGWNSTLSAIEIGKESQAWSSSVVIHSGGVGLSTTSSTSATARTLQMTENRITFQSTTPLTATGALTNCQIGIVTAPAGENSADLDIYAGNAGSGSGDAGGTLTIKGGVEDGAGLSGPVVIQSGSTQVGEFAIDGNGEHLALSSAAVADDGHLRGPEGFAIKGLNTGGSTTVNMVGLAGNFLKFGDDTGISGAIYEIATGVHEFEVGGSDAVRIGETFIEIDLVATAPVIRQEGIATGTIDAETLTILAQSLSGTAEGDGGDLLVQAGDANTDTATDHDGGNVIVRAGAQAATGANGAIIMQTDGATATEIARFVHDGNHRRLQAPSVYSENFWIEVIGEPGSNELGSYLWLKAGKGGVNTGVSGDGGDVIIEGGTGGDGSTTNGDGGDTRIRGGPVGTGGSGGSAGVVILETSTGTDVLRTTTAGGVIILDDLQLDGALNHDGSTAGFFGTTPISQPTAWDAITDNTTGTATPTWATAKNAAAAADYGGMKVTDNSSSTTITNQNDWYQFTEFSANMPARGVVPDSTTDHDLTIAVAGDYEIHADFSFFGGNIADYEWGIFVDGVLLTDFKSRRDIGTANRAGFGAISGIATLAADDEVTLRVRCTSTSSTSVTGEDVRLWVRQADTTPADADICDNIHAQIAENDNAMRTKFGSTSGLGLVNTG